MVLLHIFLPCCTRVSSFSSGFVSATQSWICHFFAHSCWATLAHSVQSGSLETFSFSCIRFATSPCAKAEGKSCLLANLRGPNQPVLVTRGGSHISMGLSLTSGSFSISKRASPDSSKRSGHAESMTKIIPCICRLQKQGHSMLQSHEYATPTSG